MKAKMGFSQTIGNAVIDAIDQIILEGSLNLSDSNQVLNLLNQFITPIDPTSLDNTVNLSSQAITQFSEAIAGANNQIFKAPNVLELFKAQKVAQTTTLADVVSALNGTKSFSALVAENTGEALSYKVKAVAINVSAIRSNDNDIFGFSS